MHLIRCREEDGITNCLVGSSSGNSAGVCVTRESISMRRGEERSRVGWN